MLKKQFFLVAFFLIFCLAGSHSLFAAQYDIKEITPEIQKALSNRQARFGELQNWKSQGTIGETNQGFVKALKGIPAAVSLTDEENKDRNVIYRAIVDQNQLGSSGFAKVKAVFADVQREKAKTGDYLQDLNGEWNQK